MSSNDPSDALKRAAWTLFDICCRQLERASGGVFEDEGESFSGESFRNYGVRGSYIGPPGANENARIVAARLVEGDAAAKDIDWMCRKFLRNDVFEKPDADEREMFSHTDTNGKPWPSKESLSDPVAASVLRATLLAGNSGDVFSFVFRWQSSALGTARTGRVRNVVAVCLMLYRLNQASPFMHSWCCGAEYAHLDIQEFVDVAVHGSVAEARRQRVERKKPAEYFADFGTIRNDRTVVDYAKRRIHDLVCAAYVNPALANFRRRIERECAGGGGGDDSKRRRLA